MTVQKIFNSLMTGLNDRQREVLTGRFGLDRNNRTQTLAALGNKYHVTRERIRQIESSALHCLREKIKKDQATADLLEKARKFLKEQGGVVLQSEMLDYLRTDVPDLSENHFAALLEATKTFYFYSDDKDFKSFYYLDKNSFKSAAAFIDQWTAFLKTKKGHVLSGKYVSLLDEFLSKKSVKEGQARSFLSVSKKIHTNPYGDSGLAEWNEIMPKTIRDRVYLVLKKKKEPVHFRVIAKTINEIFSEKNPASPPTVHNELIKDDRFVLVGRGIYALAEHGYEPGTAKEVIAKILKRNGPLKPREVILAVQKERFFKPNTVLVNLQNKNHFERLQNGTYKVRES